MYEYACMYVWLCACVYKRKSMYVCMGSTCTHLAWYTIKERMLLLLVSGFFRCLVIPFPVGEGGGDGGGGSCLYVCRHSKVAWSDALYICLSSFGEYGV